MVGYEACHRVTDQTPFLTDAGDGFDLDHEVRSRVHARWLASDTKASKTEAAIELRIGDRQFAQLSIIVGKVYTCAVVAKSIRYK